MVNWKCQIGIPNELRTTSLVKRQERGDMKDRRITTLSIYKYFGLPNTDTKKCLTRENGSDSPTTSVANDDALFHGPQYSNKLDGNRILFQNGFFYNFFSRTCIGA